MNSKVYLVWRVQSFLEPDVLYSLHQTHEGAQQAIEDASSEVETAEGMKLVSYWIEEEKVSE